MTGKASRRGAFTQSKSHCEPSPFSVVRTEWGEPPPRKCLRLRVFETQSRDELHEGKAYRFSDPERQTPSHREGWLVGDTPWGSGHPVTERPSSEGEAQRENVSSGSSGDTEHTLPRSPSTRRARVRILHRLASSRHLTFSILKLKRKVNSKGDFISGTSLHLNFLVLEDKQAGPVSAGPSVSHSEEKEHRGSSPTAFLPFLQEQSTTKNTLKVNLYVLLNM